MKKLSSISLFIFGVVLTAILTAGLVFYQDNKNSKLLVNTNQNLIQKAVFDNGVVVNPVTVTPKKDNTNIVTKTVNNTPTVVVPVKKSLTLDITEVKKHNNKNDCWFIVNGKVYDISSYFGSHPGGNSTMVPTCGIDATDAYMTQDPYASSSGSRSAHSSNAKSLLVNYYLGDLNQVISL